MIFIRRIRLIITRTTLIILVIVVVVGAAAAAMFHWMFRRMEMSMCEYDIIDCNLVGCSMGEQQRNGLEASCLLFLLNPGYVRVVD